MKLMFISDIHGSSLYAQKAIDTYKQEKADKLIILGDILYHGPRNDLPEEYAPKKVISLLNAYKKDIIAVRGNCDAEVDQMVLDFPIRSDFATVDVDGHHFFLTHGHLFDEDNLPGLNDGDIFVMVIFINRLLRKLMVSILLILRRFLCLKRERIAMVFMKRILL